MRRLHHVALAAAALCSCAPCVLDDYSDNLTGPNATDCDQFDRGTDRNPAVDCVVEAFRAHRPFRLERLMRGVDTTVIVAYVGDSDSNVYQLNWDSGTTAGDATMKQWQCVNPHVTDVACGEAWHLERNGCEGPTLTCDSLVGPAEVCP